MNLLCWQPVCVCGGGSVALWSKHMSPSRARDIYLWQWGPEGRWPCRASWRIFSFSSHYLDPENSRGTKADSVSDNSVTW